MKKELLEKDVEKYFRKVAMQDGRQPYKFTSPSRRSVPDQICLGSLASVEKALDGYGVPTAVALQVMAEAITFIECKRPGAKPTEAQIREHEKLRARGFRVLVVDSKEMVDELYGEGK